MTEIQARPTIIFIKYDDGSHGVTSNFDVNADIFVLDYKNGVKSEQLQNNQRNFVGSLGSVYEGLHMEVDDEDYSCR
jgi:hypothetical protein